MKRSIYETEDPPHCGLTNSIDRFDPPARDDGGTRRVRQYSASAIAVPTPSGANQASFVTQNWRVEVQKGLAR